MSSRCSVNEVKTGKKGVQYASSICEFETLLQLGLVKLEPLQSLGLQDSFHSAQAPFATASTAVHQDVSEIVVDNAYFDVLLDLMVWSFCLLITLNLCEGKPLPKLATFAVEGHLSDGRTESVPFDPPFPTANRFDYKCYLDNIMNSFALKVDPEKFAILSRLLEDGKEVTTRSQLHHISIDEGAEKIFAVSLSSTHSQNVSKYTLQVLHRLGFSTSLEDLSFMTGHLKEAFHVQSEIQAYHAVQDVKEDFAWNSVRQGGWRSRNYLCHWGCWDSRGWTPFQSRIDLVSTPILAIPGEDAFVGNLEQKHGQKGKDSKLSDSHRYLAESHSGTEHHFSWQDPSSSPSDHHRQRWLPEPEFFSWWTVAFCTVLFFITNSDSTGGVVIVVATVNFARILQGASAAA